MQFTRTEAEISARHQLAVWNLAHVKIVLMAYNIGYQACTNP